MSPFLSVECWASTLTFPSILMDYYPFTYLCLLGKLQVVLMVQFQRQLLCESFSTTSKLNSWLSLLRYHCKFKILHCISQQLIKVEFMALSLHVSTYPHSLPCNFVVLHPPPPVPHIVGRASFPTSDSDSLPLTSDSVT